MYSKPSKITLAVISVATIWSEVSIKSGSRLYLHNFFHSMYSMCILSILGRIFWKCHPCACITFSFYFHCYLLLFVAFKQKKDCRCNCKRIKITSTSWCNLSNTYALCDLVSEGNDSYRILPKKPEMYNREQIKPHIKYF